MTILVTGVAGFIGAAVAQALLSRGEAVVGIDNMNDYYDVRLKEARLARLTALPGFTFRRADIADRDGFTAALSGLPVRKAVHLAAQAGVRYSLTNPFAYIQSNLLGQAVILEYCRNQAGFEHLVYASSSSVYGGNTKLPFSEQDPVDRPVSLYAATKKADELMGHAYSHLFGIPQTGLRFFTVYGPWGRPDMALFLFTRAILAGEAIPIFNHGDMERDFTYIDDIVDGVIRALDHPPAAAEGAAAHRVYNIGNNRPTPLLHLVAVLEAALGRKAIKRFEPMQPGDVKATYADITAIERDLGFSPATSIEEGVPRFVAWYRSFYEGAGAVA